MSLRQTWVAGLLSRLVWLPTCFCAILNIGPASGAEKPNIVIILADDLGYGDLGCYGSNTVASPHLDNLAADGIRFTDFHSNGAVCSPTRAALLTGRYQQRTGITGVVTAKSHRHTGLDLQETTFAELAKTAGYSTGLFGKWHVGYQTRFNPIHQGFDDFIGFVAGNVDYHAHLDQTGIEDWWNRDHLAPEAGYATDLITDHGVKFIERNRDRPFLLYLAHGAPHYPYQGRNDPVFYSRGKGKTKQPYREGVYEEMIGVLDEGVGRIRDALESASLTDNTLIFFFSDNGPARPGSSGPLRGKKGSIWEGGHRVPAIACWPGKLPAGRLSAATAMGADLLPTIAELAGAPLPEATEIDGVSIAAYLTESKPLPARPLFWGIGNKVAVRRGRFKLIANSELASPKLFDLQADPSESHNLAEQKQDLVAELLALLQRWQTDVNAGVAKRS